MVMECIYGRTHLNTGGVEGCALFKDVCVAVGKELSGKREHAGRQYTCARKLEDPGFRVIGPQHETESSTRYSPG